MAQSLMCTGFSNLLLTAALLASSALAQPSTPVIIDTDAGSDDLMAIALLLAHPEVRIEAITVANGLAHVRAGASNILRLIALANHQEIPVYVGPDHPLRGGAEFPAEWRRNADELPGVHLPKAERAPESRSAADYLANRLKQRGKPARILALGPLTNIAAALEQIDAPPRAVEQLVIMGGAINVPGNLGDGGAFQTSNKTAEWNMFVDPFAADIVFRSGIPIRLVPLDATNRVKIDAVFLREFRSQGLMRLGEFVSEVLGTEEAFINDGTFYAWDPLAAASIVDVDVLRVTALRIEICQNGPESGRTAHAKEGTANADVALGVDVQKFHDVFFRRTNFFVPYY